MKNPPDPSSDEPLFHISHIDRVYTLKTDTLNERSHTHTRTCARTHTHTSNDLSSDFTTTVVHHRTNWVQRIKAASEVFIETEKKKREKAYQGKHRYL